MECPHCGQRMLTRHGVQLSPRQADLFDLIERASSRGGIDMDTLGWTWAGAEKSKKAQVALIKTTIANINDRLASTDLKIRAVSRQPTVYALFSADSFKLKA